MRNENEQASAERARRFRPSYSGMRINAGGGALVSKDLSLNEEEADRAVAALLARAQKAVADRQTAGPADPVYGTPVHQRREGQGDGGEAAQSPEDPR